MAAFGSLALRFTSLPLLCECLVPSILQPLAVLKVSTPDGFQARDVPSLTDVQRFHSGVILCLKMACISSGAGTSSFLSSKGIHSFE
jgi:hypothetical protein